MHAHTEYVFPGTPEHHHIVPPHHVLMVVVGTCGVVLLGVQLGYTLGVAVVMWLDILR